MSLRRVLKNGFTLLEMLLVIAIMSAIFVMIIGYTTQKSEQMRIDRAALQMQQILNAGLAYYVNSGAWPVNGAPANCSSTDLSILKTAGYLPSETINNPWGGAYSLNCNPQGTLTLTTTIELGAATSGTLAILAGRLPMASYDAAAGTVTASINIPGQNLNNSRSVNFAGIYHSGACVPVPSCPGNMVPQIMVAPASVSGVNDNPQTTGACGPGVIDYTQCSAMNAYPISSYTATAYGPVNYTNSGNVPTCPYDSSSTGDCIADESGNHLPSGNYWRVCLSVTTPKGTVQPHNMAWGQAMGSVMAVTRCAAPGEPSGPDFFVFY